jgi:hypothetical protein
MNDARTSVQVVDRRRLALLIWRELTLITRTGAFWVATTAYALVVAAFALTWSDGFPVAGGAFFDQSVALQTGLLTLLLPWAGARFSGKDRAGVVMLAAATASPPSRVIAAKCLGLTAALACIVMAGAPHAVLAQQISALPASRVPADMLPLLSLAVFVAAASAAGVLVSVNPLLRWLGATAATAAVVYAIPRGPISATIFLGLGVIFFVALAWRADSTLRYLPERHGS